MSTEKRGGVRPGAGRKPSPNKKIKISTALHPDVVKILRESPMPIALYIELAVTQMHKRLKYLK